MSHQETEKEIEAEQKKPVGLSTPMTLGLILGFMGIVGSLGFIAHNFGVQLASISTKLDSLAQLRSADMAIVANLSRDVSELQRWRIQVDAAGSPTMKTSVEEIRKELEALRVELKLHMERDVMKGKTP